MSILIILASDWSMLIILASDGSILTVDAFQIFKDVKRVVDLCAAPGSWSQVLSKKLRMEVIWNYVEKKRQSICEICIRIF